MIRRLHRPAFSSKRLFSIVSERTLLRSCLEDGILPAQQGNPVIGARAGSGGGLSSHTRVLFDQWVRIQMHRSKNLLRANYTFVMTEFDLLQKPEYIHVALNHLPIYGTILGALALAISLVLRSRAAQITALIITLLAATSAYPLLVTGRSASDPIPSIADDTAAEALHEHM